jgi:hypothetical protein
MLIAPLREWDGRSPCLVQKRWCRVVKVEPPLLPARDVLREHEVDVLRLHVLTQHEADAAHDLGLPRLIELEEVAPQVEMRCYTEVCLVEVDG